VQCHSGKGQDETRHGWLVVIDGLDECEDPIIQEDLLRILAEAIPKLPFRFRFLVTSRAEAHILRTFDHNPSFAKVRVQRIDLGEDPNAVEDIQRVLELDFQTIRRTHPLAKYLDSDWPSPKDVQTLTSRASTQFIYIATVIKCIRSPKHRPDERLKIIIELSNPPASDKPYAQLDSLYSHVLSGVAEEHLADVILVFSILHHLGLWKETTLRRFENRLKGLEDLFGKKEGDLRIQLDPLRSLIAIPDDDFSPIKVYYASLFDYLLDEGRSGALHIRHGSAEEALALHDITEMSNYLSELNCGGEISTLFYLLISSFVSGQPDLDYPLYRLSYLIQQCHRAQPVPDSALDYLQALPYLYKGLLDHPGVVQPPINYLWDFYQSSQLIFDLFRSRKVRLTVCSDTKHLID